MHFFIKTGSRLIAIATVAAFAVTIACSGDSITSSVPTAPSIVTGKVSGLVRGEAAPSLSRFPPNTALPNATVTVVGGPASGTTATTRADGTYEIVASGTFKLRFEHPFYIPAESAETVMSANGITLPEVRLTTAPWSISGRVVDSLGNPIRDADVSILPGEFLNPYGTARTDADGRYTVSSSSAHAASVIVTARRPGFQPMESLFVAPCCETAPLIKLVRIVSITPTAPGALRVGESLEMPASVIVFDTGEIRNVFVLPESSAPAVVAVNRSSIWYAMRGVSAGDATLTFDLWGAVATLPVHVRP